MAGLSHSTLVFSQILAQTQSMLLRFSTFRNSSSSESPREDLVIF